jgi:hypothetical protein
MESSVLAVLTHIVDIMEKNGATHKLVSFDIDENLVNEIYDGSGHQYSISELQTAADKCLAHEWIEHRSIGEKYSHLCITEKGVGIVRSKRKQDLDRKSRNTLKKTSDYIEEHKGLFMLLSFVVALVALIISYGKK